MKILAELRPMLLPHRTVYLIAVAALVASTVLVLFLPKKIGEFLEATSANPNFVSIDAMMQPGIEIAMLGMGQAILSGIYGYLVAIASERTGNDLRARFFESLLSRPLLLDGQQRSGEIASEFVSDLSIIQMGVGDTLIAFLRHVLFVCGALIAMFWINATMAMVTLASSAVVAALSLLMIRFVTRALLNAQMQRSQVIGTLLESANNRYVIEAFSRREYFVSRFRTQLSSLFSLLQRHQRFLAIINPILFIVLAMATLAVLYTGVIEIQAGRIRASDLIAFVTYVLILVAALMNAGTSAGGLAQAAALYAKHRGMLSAGSVYKTTPTVLELRLPQRSSEPTGYRFSDVRFRFPNAASDVLRGVSFTVPAGKTTALVGESGAGKSTLSSLMLGLIQPNSGEIERSGLHSDAAGAVAVVPQNPFLFSGSVADNIRFGRSDIDDAAIENAARLAHIASFIRALPDGFGHILEENGSNLSRGQQQRIALARALAGNPGTLILDEATASLDPASENAIATALRELEGKRTIFIIAHKGKLLDDVDRLIVLVNGEIEYEGVPPSRSMALT